MIWSQNDNIAHFVVLEIYWQDLQYGSVWCMKLGIFINLANRFLGQKIRGYLLFWTQIIKWMLVYWTDVLFVILRQIRHFPKIWDKSGNFSYCASPPFIFLYFQAFISLPWHRRITFVRDFHHSWFHSVTFVNFSKLLWYFIFHIPLE